MRNGKNKGGGRDRTQQVNLNPLIKNSLLRGYNRNTHCSLTLLTVWVDFLNVLCSLNRAAFC